VQSNMLIENEEIQLTDLLRLALGGGAGEVGAVNFNYLHEFLYGLIHELGISRNVTYITHEVSSTGSNTGVEKILSSNAPISQNSSVSSKPERKPSPLAVLETEGDISGDSADIKQSGIQQNDTTVNSETTVNNDAAINQNFCWSSPNKKKVSDQSSKDTSELERNQNQQEESTQQQNQAGKSESQSSSKVSEPIQDSESSSQKVIKKQEEMQKPDGYDTNRRRSSLGNNRAIRGAGQYGSRGSMGGSQMMDINEINTKLESGEGLTKAGEMWHVMNINRRVETAEAGIEGLTSMIDSLKDAFEDIKSKAQDKEEELERKIQDNLRKYGGVDSGGKEIVKSNDTNDLSKTVSDLNKKMFKFATKDEIKPLCNIAQVKEMIDKNLRAYSAANSNSGAVKETVVPEVTAVTATNVHDPTADTEEIKQVLVDFEVNMDQKLKGLTDNVITLANELNNLKDTNSSITKLQNEINAVQNHIYSTATSVPSSTEHGKKKVDTSPDINMFIEPIRINLKNLTDSVNQLKSDFDSVQNIANSLNETSQMTKKDLIELQDRNNTFSEAQKNMANTLSQLQRDIQVAKGNLQNAQGGNLQKKSSNINQDAALSKLRGTIYDLEERQTVLQNELTLLSQAERKLENELKDANTKTTSLEANKTDKQFVLSQVEPKAEKKDLKNVITRNQFDDCVMGIDRNIQNLVQDLQSNEAKSAKTFNNLQDILADKLNRDDAIDIRGYIDSRFKSFKPKMPPAPPAEDYAAGSRKKLMPDCNCISCDRPVGVPCHDQCPTLPYFHALPGMKSIRPVTTFELQTIRQHMQPGIAGNKERFYMSETREKLQKELLQLCNAQDLDDLGLDTPNRPCGGVHTLGQHRKNYGSGRPPMFYREDYSQFQTADIQRKERDVIGKDGHIYKGRAPDSTLPDVHTIPKHSRSVEIIKPGSKTSLRSSSPKKDGVVTVLPSVETTS